MSIVVFAELVSADMFATIGVQHVTACLCLAA